MQPNKCQDCDEVYIIDCYYPADGSPEQELFAGHYCSDHAKKHGFCFGCGEFWGGVESFEFSQSLGGIEGYCENCSGEIRAEEEDMDEEEYYDY